MNRTQHSPGPWTVETREHVHAIQDRNGQDLTYQDTTPNENHGSITSRSRLKIETLANARLIAAAPELLEALQNIVGTYNDSDRWTQGDEPEPVEIQAARAAIAKATGDAQI